MGRDCINPRRSSAVSAIGLTCVASISIRRTRHASRLTHRACGRTTQTAQEPRKIAVVNVNSTHKHIWHVDLRLTLTPASAGVRAKVTSVGWQVTLCDPMWHVSSRSGVATLRTAIHLLLTYLRAPLLTLDLLTSGSIMPRACHARYHTRSWVRSISGLGLVSKIIGWVGFCKLDPQTCLGYITDFGIDGWSRFLFWWFFGSIARTQWVDAAIYYACQLSHICVGNMDEPWKNDWTRRDAVWEADSFIGPIKLVLDCKYVSK